MTLAEHQLSTDLHVENPSATETIDFQALLHTYIRAPADNVLVTSLHGLSYYDKTEATDEARAAPKTETRQEVDVKTFTDSVYEGAPGHYRVTWPGGSLEIRATEFKDVVVWNPQEEGQKIGDMEVDGWYASPVLFSEPESRPLIWRVLIGRSMSALNQDTFAVSSRLSPRSLGWDNKCLPLTRTDRHALSKKSVGNQLEISIPG